MMLAMFDHALISQFISCYPQGFVGHLVHRGQESGHFDIIKEWEEG